MVKVGEIVGYRSRFGPHAHPAIVVHVKSETVVSLVVFTDHPDGMGERFVECERNVPWAAEGPDTWSELPS